MFGDWIQIAEKGAAAVLVLALLCLLIWVLRKQGFAQLAIGRTLTKAQRRLSVLERLPLTSQHSLYLVQAAGETLLIGSSPSGISLIDSVGCPQSPASPPEARVEATQEW